MSEKNHIFAPQTDQRKMTRTAHRPPPRHRPSKRPRARFTFTGKERDKGTCYSYFGARHMDHELMTMWLSVDPLADKYPGISPYNYCMWNPVKLVGPVGRFPTKIYKEINADFADLVNSHEGLQPGLSSVGRWLMETRYKAAREVAQKETNQLLRQIDTL